MNKKMRWLVNFAQGLLLIMTLSNLALAQGDVSASKVKNFVMWHLAPTGNSESIKTELKALKNLGVDGVTIDMWWGVIEPEKDKFNWEYYKTFFAAAKEVGIDVKPIFSFHKAGGNVGDTAHIPLPQWIWSLAPDMKFIDVNGFQTDEVVAFWVPEIYERYAKVIQSFADNFKDYNSIIKGFYVADGPAGEARYPSYQGAAGWNFPDPGFFQSYSRRAKTDFRLYVRAKYKNINAVNKAWGTKLKSFLDVEPPSQQDTPYFFQEGWKSQYGTDSLNWYQVGLEDYVEKMFSISALILKNRNRFYYNAPLEGKMAGVHWLVGDPNIAHAAERTAGYVNYERLIKIFARHHAELTFTTVEIKNHDWFISRGPGQEPVSDYGRPEELIDMISHLATQYNVPLSGENALTMYSKEDHYQQARSVLSRYNFNSFTFLRMESLVNPDGSETWESGLYRKYLNNIPLHEGTSFEIKEEERKENPLNVIIADCEKRLRLSSLFTKLHPERN